MTPERWQQIIELFNAALGREPSERTAFLDGACGEDLSLREEVISLISSYEQAGDFIEEPAFDFPTVVLTQNQARPSDSSDLIAGQTVGPYTVIALLGEGGMGKVYLADDPRLGRRIALKIISGVLSKNTDLVARFELEARNASLLNHPNILTVYDVGQIESLRFIATEFVEGETLRQHISKREIELIEGLDIALQIGSALSEAHKNRIVHRDIKPENIMLRPDGLVKVLDFGLAKLTEHKAEEGLASAKPGVQTEPGIVMGSPRYMSPEQARGLAVDTRTDIFSFGVVLYELLTGQPPFNGATVSDVIASVLEKEPSPVSAHRPGIHAEIERVVTRALRKDLKLRYQTIDEPILRLKEIKRSIEKELDATISITRESSNTKLNNLPVPLTPIMGRDAETAAIKNILNRDNVRLLTLTGPGGTGKTRLGLEVTHDLINEYEHGVYFVSLAAITDPALVAPTIAQALGLRQTGPRPLIEIAKEYLQNKQVLLLLDNFEQVTSAAPVIVELLTACLRVKILATSRAPLHVRGEHEFAVPPLSIPDEKHLPSAEAILKYPAVALFVQRAAAIRPDFAINDESARVVAEICIRLDGLPLAIELAAARIKVLPLRTILTRLENRLKILVVEMQDLPARQRTMRSAIAWSYDLLNEQEKRFFRRLGVFVGGFTLEAAEIVCNRAIGLEIDTLDGLASLVDKSLLTRKEATGCDLRFAMLETIREYALDRLELSDESNETRHTQASYYLGLVEKSEMELIGPQQAVWLTTLETELDNLRTAMWWFKESGQAEFGLRMAAIPLRFWEVRGYLSEGRSSLKALLEAGRQGEVSDLTRARALSGAGALAQHQSDYEEAERLLEQGLILHRQIQNTEGVAFSLNFLGLLAYERSDATRAIELLEESLALYYEIRDKRGMAFSLNHLGVVALCQGDYKQAEQLQEECLAIRREMGDKLGIASSLNNLGVIALDDGNYKRAIELLTESLTLFREIEDKLGVAASLSNLGEIAQYEGDYNQAAQLFGESIALFRKVGDKRNIITLLNNLADVARCQGDYDRAMRLYLESLALSQEIGEKPGIAASLEGQAYLASLQDQAERAALLLGMAEALRQVAGVPMPPVRRPAHESCVAALNTKLGEEEFQRLIAQARAMSLKDAIDYAQHTSTNIP